MNTNSGIPDTRVSQKLFNPQLPPLECVGVTREGTLVSQGQLTYLFFSKVNSPFDKSEVLLWYSEVRSSAHAMSEDQNSFVAFIQVE